MIPADHPAIFRTRGPGRTAHLLPSVVLTVSSIPGVHYPGISLEHSWAFPISSKQSCSPQHVLWASDTSEGTVQLIYSLARKGISQRSGYFRVLLLIQLE